jgi:hypothetical protein
MGDNIMKKQFTSIVIVLFLPLTVFAQNVEQKNNPILVKVHKCLKPVLVSLNPKPSIEYTNRGRSLAIKFRARKFMIHSGSMVGKYSLKAHETTAPAYDGFMLKVHLQEAGTVNQAVVPQTIKQPYWITDLDVTQVSGTKKQIYWGLSYGSRMDMRILSDIKAEIKKLDKTKADKLLRKSQQQLRNLVSERRDELTGIFKNNVKSLSPYLLNLPGGSSIGLHGDILKSIPDGTRIWIRGEIHSRFYSSNDPNSAMAPRVWHIFMDVETYEKIDKPYGLPQLKR